MHKVKLHTVFMLLIAGYLPTFAQEYNVIHYKDKPNLPHTLYKSAAQDSFGFMWFATDQGLVRYNGIEFRHYLDELPSEYAKYLLYTQDKRLLASTDSGIIEIHAQPDSAYFTMLLRGGKQASDSTIVYPKQIMQDSQKRIWISGRQRVAKYDNGQFTFYPFGKKDFAQSFYNSFSLIEDGFGHLICFSYTGNAFYFDETENRFTPIDGASVSTQIDAVKRIAPGRFLIGGSQGIRMVGWNNDLEVTLIESITRNKAVSDIVQLSENEFWVSTWTEGVFKLTFLISDYRFRQTGFAGLDKVARFFPCENGNTWVMGVSGLSLIQEKPFLAQAEGIGDKYIENVTEIGDAVYATNGKILFKKEKGKRRFETIFESEEEDIFLNIEAFNGKVYLSTSKGRFFVFKNDVLESKVQASDKVSSIFQLRNDKKGRLWFCQDGFKGIASINPAHEVSFYDADKGMNYRALFSKVLQDGKLIVGARGKEFLYEYDSASDRFLNISPEIPEQHEDMRIRDIEADSKGVLYCATNRGVWKSVNNQLQQINLGKYTAIGTKGIEIDRNDVCWVTNRFGLMAIDSMGFSLLRTANGLASNNVPYRCIEIDSENQLWVGTSNGLSVSRNTQTSRKSPSPVFLSVLADGEKWDYQAPLTEGSFMKFRFSLPSFPNERALYEIKVQPDHTEWQPLNHTTYYLLASLKPGDYTVLLRAKQDGLFRWSNGVALRFHVKPFWYKTFWGVALIVVILLIIIFLSAKLYAYRLVRQKKKLEKKVSERTSELNAQKEELQTQKEELSAQNTRITEQNEHINASIRYAETIQGAILPLRGTLEKHFDHFIMFRPKSIVSGDFYWFAVENAATVNEKKFLAVIDCTGHGVPGAFMSMISYSLLNEIVKVRKVNEPKLILDELNKSIVQALKQEFTENNDGLDLSLVRFDEQNPERTRLVYAGARATAYIYRQKEKQLERLQPDRQSIGGFQYRDESFRYKQQEIQLRPGDMIYFSTDGYKDQNSLEEKRFGRKKFRELLLGLAPLPTKQQGQEAERIFDEFKQETEQLDDVTLMGIRV